MYQNNRYFSTFIRSVWRSQRLRRLKRSILYLCLCAMTILICVGGVPAWVSGVTAIEATNLAPNVPETTSLTAATLEQQGQFLYEAKRYAEAAHAFQQAAYRYQHEGNTVQQAIVLSNQALAYQHLGEWGAANQAIASSLSQFEHSNSNHNRSEQWARSQILDIQGHLLLAQGNAESAIDAWETASQGFQELGHDNRAMESQVNHAQALQTWALNDERGRFCSTF
ncbi:MAG: tetratricopeptide repeat protein [Merismopedia sp. SIO2A8]|nr:tetratricopeptide repeat protein [Merismopedia sp. SIO2A8]